jgi:glycosyltransferase involved in cell wall biosynthesis
MRICYVASDVVVPHHRGASTHVYEVSKNLALLGHEVHVVSRRTGWTQPSHETLGGFNVHRVFRGILAPTPRSAYDTPTTQEEGGSSLAKTVYGAYLKTVHMLYAAVVAARLIARNRLDIVLERETSWGAGALAAAITARPAVLEIIGPRYSAISVRKARRILVYTDSATPALEAKKVIVPAGADTDAFKPGLDAKEVRRRYNLSGRPVVGYVGTFAGWHGLPDLVKASKTILEHLPTARFLMVGPYYEKTARLARETDLADAYVFTGPMPYLTVPQFISASDVLVAPYNPDNQKEFTFFPLKIIEYMACGKAVVTTPVGVIPNLVKNGENGLLVKPGNPSELAQAIVRLLADRDLAERLGRRARDTVQEEYSWRSFARRLEHILIQAAKGS